jgi:nitroreductase
LDFQRLPEDEMRARAEAQLASMRRRRSVRAFSPDPIPVDVVRTCIDVAAQAPSGAHKQPWTFVLVRDPAVRRRIREAAEKEEQAFYGGRAPQRWLDDLAPFGTDAAKPYLETAPALVVVFAQRHGQEADERHYYVQESVGLATGFLLAALHDAGLATLTHTPSPMGFLSEVLQRPPNERPYLLIPVGYPALDCEVPDLQRKTRDAYLVEV